MVAMTTSDGVIRACGSQSFEKIKKKEFNQNLTKIGILSMKTCHCNVEIVVEIVSLKIDLCR